MGCGGSTQIVPVESDQDALLKNKTIEQDIKQDRDADLKLAKLLLLGAGESGKTTVFKQSHIIYGKGFPDSDRKTYTPIVRRNVITAMKMLSIMAPKYVTTKVAPELDGERKLLEETGEDDMLTGTIALAIKALWADTAIRETFAHRSKFQMSDSSSYFLDKVETLADENYIPNVEDVLRARVPTTGIVEHEFLVGNSTFKMFDVGGQRSERKKWIHCFENVTAVLFVVAMSEYDQVLFEDNVTNRMAEALKLFDETCNSQYLKKVPFILFLNKRDLFAEKIKFAPLSQYFPEFDAKNNSNFETCANFLRDKFLILNKQKGRPMYYHITCATDTNNIRAVFKAVRDIVIRRGLAEAGLME